MSKSAQRPTPRRPQKARPAAARPRRTLRLPETVRPDRIELDLGLDPRRRPFRGEARYALRLSRATSWIELHAAELDVTRVRAVLEDGTTVAATVEPHGECETIVLRFDRRLPAGPLALSLRFRGRTRDDLRGLYRSSDRKAPWLATQLCPTDARRLFPCFDEPGIKARYVVRVDAPADLVVLSNAPAEKRGRATKGRRTTTFAETPPLSVYLLAVAVGPFEVGTAAVAGTTPIRVYTPPGSRRLGRFAREAAVESLVRLERWFGMPHPYEKLDLLALPDFAFGAMENAGAVFFRDSVLLLDEKTASPEDRLRAAETIAHEIAHMWFGNLVTMAWWNDLWLNESFATWMAYEIVHDWKPEWGIWNEFINRREQALELDALPSTHAIAPPIRTAEEAHENFDAITYTKGAAMLRMLERFIGPARFRKGVRRYIRRHQESNATAEDLWQALEEATGLDVAGIVGPWTAREGYPIVATSADRKGGLRLRQSRFRLLPVRGKRSNAPEPAWQIPWRGRPRKGRGRPVAHLLTRRSIRLEGAPTDLYPNADEAGFFRIDPGIPALRNLVDVLPRLATTERIGWLGHHAALVRVGRAPIDSLLDAVAALAEEPEAEVLIAVERVLSPLHQRLAPDLGPETAAGLDRFITDVFAPAALALGVHGRRKEPVARRRRRARLLALVAGATPPASLVEACERSVEAYLAGSRALPVGPDGIVLSIGARHADARQQAALEGRVRRAATPQERRRALSALASIDSQAGLARTLRASLDRRLAPAVDRAMLLMQLLGARRTAAATWDHLRREWPRLENEMPPILLARLAGETARALPDHRIPEIRRFFAKHPLAAGERVLDQIDEETAIARQLARHAGQDLRETLARRAIESSPVG